MVNRWYRDSANKRQLASKKWEKLQACIEMNVQRYRSAVLIPEAQLQLLLGCSKLQRYTARQIVVGDVRGLNDEAIYALQASWPFACTLVVYKRSSDEADGTEE